VTFELACHLCNTFHAEREGCAPKYKAPICFPDVIETPAIDLLIHKLQVSPLDSDEIDATIEALQEIRALLGGKS